MDVICKVVPISALTSLWRRGSRTEGNQPTARGTVFEERPVQRKGLPRVREVWSISRPLARGTWPQWRRLDPTFLPSAVNRASHSQGAMKRGDS